MGIFEVLTVIFVVLKLTGVIAWSWWVVFSPMMIALSIYFIYFTAILLLAKRAATAAEGLRSVSAWNLR